MRSVARPVGEDEGSWRRGYLAEVYLPRVGEFDVLTSPVVAAARAIRGEGTPVRHLRSIFVPEDQTCLLLFEAGSPETVQQVTERAGLEVTRVVEAIEALVPGRRGAR